MVDMVDVDSRPFIDEEPDPGSGLVGRERHRHVDGREAESLVETDAEQAVPIGFDVEGNQGLARARGQDGAQVRVGDRAAGGEHDVGDEGARPLRDAQHDHDGRFTGRAAAGRGLDGRGARRVAEAPSPVRGGDRPHVRLEARLDERAAGGETHERHQLGRRQRGRPLDAHACHAIEGPVPDGEHDVERIAGRDPLVRRVAVAVALRPEVILDARLGVLQQVLVDRALTFGRHELGQLLRGQGVVLHRHGHERPAEKRDEEVDGGPVVRHLGVRRDAGLVVAARAPVLGRRVEPAPDGHTVVVVAPSHRHARLDVGGIGRILGPVGDRPHPRPRAARHPEHDIARLVRRRGHDLDRRPEMTPIGQVILDRPRDVGGPAARRRGAEAILDEAPQFALGEAEIAAEDDAPHFAQRHEVDVDAHPVGLRGHGHLDVDVAPHAHQVHDRVAHGIHRERRPGADLDEAFELRIADAPAFRPQLHLAHGAPRERLRHLCPQRGRAPRERGQRQAARRAERPAGHLKTYRTRTSSA
jgi:hypothetical protein